MQREECRMARVPIAPSSASLVFGKGGLEVLRWVEASEVQHRAIRRDVPEFSLRRELTSKWPSILVSFLVVQVWVKFGKIRGFQKHLVQLRDMGAGE